jgi:pimeloyl-ACP methyl ester carboxylesterase
LRGWQFFLQLQRNFGEFTLRLNVFFQRVKFLFKGERESMTVICTILLIIFISYSILGWTIYFLQPRFMYRPVAEVLYNPGDINLIYEKVSLKTADGLKISAWFVPCVNARKTVLFCHGNGGNMSHRLDTINLLNEMGLNCLLFDYRGYGDSQGKPSEEGTYCDAEAAWDWLTAMKGIKPHNIVIFGRSMGGAIASHLAGKVHPAALVVESSFTSYVDLGKKIYPYLPVKQFASFDYNTLEYIKKVTCPTLVMHSKADEIIPYEFAPILFQAASEPKEFVEIFGIHNNGFLFSGEIYTQAWGNWIDSIESRQQRNKLLKRIS